MKHKLWFWVSVLGWRLKLGWTPECSLTDISGRSLQNLSPGVTLNQIFQPDQRCEGFGCMKSSSFWPELFPQSRTNEPRDLTTCSCGGGPPTCWDWSGGPSLEMGSTQVWSSRSHTHKPGCVRKSNFYSEKPPKKLQNRQTVVIIKWFCSQDNFGSSSLAQGSVS